MALPAGRKGVLPSELTPEGKIKGSSYTLPTASAETLGGVKVGSGLSIENGVLSAPGYELPTAAAETLGGVKIGTGLNIDSGGVLSVDASSGYNLYERQLEIATITAKTLTMGTPFQPPAALVGKKIVSVSSVDTDGYVVCVGICKSGEPMSAEDWLYPLLLSDRDYTAHTITLKILYA